RELRPLDPFPGPQMAEQPVARLERAMEEEDAVALAQAPDLLEEPGLCLRPEPAHLAHAPGLACGLEGGEAVDAERLLERGPLREAQRAHPGQLQGPAGNAALQRLEQRRAAFLVELGDHAGEPRPDPADLVEAAGPRERVPVPGEALDRLRAALVR